MSADRCFCLHVSKFRFGRQRVSSEDVFTYRNSLEQDCLQLRLRFPPRQPSFSRPGMILVLVLAIVTVLSFAALAIVRNLSTETRSLFYEADQVQLEQVLLSGVEYIKAFAEATPEEQEALGGPYDNPSRFERIAVTDPSGTKTVGYFSVRSLRGHGVEGGPETYFGLESENAKLSLQALLLWEGTRVGLAREALLRLPGMTEAVADSILDWIDPDEDRRTFGAEADYYAGLRLPYRPRNDLPVALEELLLVRGVGRIQLLGGSFRGVSSGFSSLEGQAGLFGGNQPWISYLTPYNGERNIAPDGSPRINLNDSDLTRLHGRLAEEFFPELADFVIFFRQFGPAAGSREGPREAESSDAAGSISPNFSRPGSYLFRSIFDCLGQVVEVEGQEGQSVQISCPLTSDPDRLREWLPQWVDKTTTTGDPVIYGRVNVLRAPREVLLAIPGMDSSLAERILTTRRSGGLSEGQRSRNLARLYLEGVLTLEQLRQLGPFITTGGDIWTAEVVAEASEEGTKRLRARVAVDATRYPARQIYWKMMGDR